MERVLANFLACRAESKKASWDVFEVVGEILAAHTGARHAFDGGFTEQIDGDGLDEVRKLGVVDHTWRARLDVEVDGRTCGIGEGPGEFLNMVDGYGSGFLSDAAHRATHGTVVGNHVEGFAAFDLADGDDDGVLGIDNTRDAEVDTVDKLSGGGDGIEGFVRATGVPPPTVNIDKEFVAIGGHDVFPKADLTDGSRGVDVKTEDGGKIVDGSFVNHLEGADACFLGGLEDRSPRYVCGKSFGMCEAGKTQDGAVDHGRMGIVPACVHDVVRLAGVIGGLGIVDVEGIDIGTESYLFVGGSVVIYSKASFGADNLGGKIEFGDKVSDVLGGLVFLAAGFGMGVEMASDLRDSVGVSVDRAVESILPGSGSIHIGILGDFRMIVHRSIGFKRTKEAVACPYWEGGQA